MCNEAINDADMLQLTVMEERTVAYLTTLKKMADEKKHVECSEVLRKRIAPYSKEPTECRLFREPIQVIPEGNTLSMKCGL